MTYPIYFHDDALKDIGVLCITSDNLKGRIQEFYHYIDQISFEEDHDDMRYEKLCDTTDLFFQFISHIRFLKYFKSLADFIEKASAKKIDASLVVQEYNQILPLAKKHLEILEKQQEELKEVFPNEFLEYLADNL